MKVPSVRFALRTCAVVAATVAAALFASARAEDEVRAVVSDPQNPGALLTVRARVSDSPFAVDPLRSPNGKPYAGFSRVANGVVFAFYRSGEQLRAVAFVPAETPVPPRFPRIVPLRENQFCESDGGNVRCAAVARCEFPVRSLLTAGNRCDCRGANDIYSADGSRCVSQCAANQQNTGGRCAMCPGLFASDPGGVCECRSPNALNLAKDQCVASCEPGQAKVNAECRVASRENCFAAGMVVNPVDESECVASCPGDLIAAGGMCRPRPAGTAGELARTMGAKTVGLDFAHNITLVDGTPLRGDGVTVAIVEPTAIHWDASGGGDGGNLGGTFTGDPVVPVSVSPTTHSELPSIRVFGYDPLSIVAPGPDEEVSVYDGTPGEAFHGIAVAGIIAAKDNGIGPTGVAPEADILYNVINFRYAVPVFREVIGAGAEIVNNSWGLARPGLLVGDFQHPDGGDAGRTKTRENIVNFLHENAVGDDNPSASNPGAVTYPAFVHQGERDPADRVIYVWAAGNMNGMRLTEDLDLRDFELPHGNAPFKPAGTVINADRPALVAGLPHYFPEMTLSHIAVAAVNEFATPVTTGGLVQAPIWDFSNRCGSGSRTYCIAAPGVAEFDIDGGYHQEFNDIYSEIATERGYDCLGGMYCFVPCVFGFPFCPLIPSDAEESILREANIRWRAEVIPREFAKTGPSTFIDMSFVLAPQTSLYAQQEGNLPAGYDFTQGTSFSAPIVSGALALMKQFFRAGTGCDAGDLCGLGNDELVARMLETADRRGIYADEAKYGAGLLDLRSALTPRGSLRMMAGSSLSDGRGWSRSQSALSAGGALSDSFRRGLLSAPVAAFDELDAPFAVSAESLLSESDSRLRTTGDALRELRGGGSVPSFAVFDSGSATAWWSLNAPGDSFILSGESRNPLLSFSAKAGTHFGLQPGNGFRLSPERNHWERNRWEGNRWAGNHRGAFANPYAALAGDGMVAGMSSGGWRVAAFGESPLDDGARRTRGVLAEFDFSSGTGIGSGGKGGKGGKGGVGVGVGVGFVRESESALSSTGTGGFSGIRARTAFAGLRWESLSGESWDVRAAAYAGRTDSPGGGEHSWWGGASGIWSGSFAAEVGRLGIFRSDDVLSFRVSQPLRAEGGTATFLRPTGRTKYGDLTYKTERWSTRPSGRELVAEATYRIRVDGNGPGAITFSAAATKNPNHRAAAKTTGRALFLLEREF